MAYNAAIAVAWQVDPALFRGWVLVWEGSASVPTTWIFDLRTQDIGLNRVSLYMYTYLFVYIIVLVVACGWRG